ncbi:PREDICTED: E3 ubiquitin-protein ligase NRDP1-like [Rhagoletis zephyria]|uniref:E3 ubiquitin-protein ligase NRDP1-like n=1 Tax=Rhagoletis zephyria TaxID=28612 RepID=UPI0008118C47|nr:PREDICTED: E3 ubiquitin-protein ligase NRDP1-like [Rhagoletis zephyria]KAH9404060.1 E3 ubiquitin-protein ligase NRDP1 [Tyrophagus putrescentiae]
MGYDLNRFQCKIYDEVICCICFGVLENAYEIAECGHLYCERCIKGWLESPMYSFPTCPTCRNEICEDDIRPAPEFIRTFIGQLAVSCDFADAGCIVNVPLCELNRHRAHCPLNPLKPIACSRGCGVHLPPSQMLSHQCDLDLCQEAIVWSEIFETAKLVVRMRNYKRYQNKHGLVGLTAKKFVNLFTKWMADPRIQEAANAAAPFEHITGKACISA